MWLASAWLAALPALSAAPVAPQAPAGKPPRTAPSQCPYCKGDPARLAAAGLASHGPFAFGAGSADTQSVSARLLSDVYWIESAHFEIGFGIGPYRVSLREKEKVAQELARLALVLPEVDPKTKLLDEWLRAHLFAQRCEDAYARFLGLVQKSDADFPESADGWMLGTPFRGVGPHLGQGGKFEVLILESEEEQVGYLRDQFGLEIKRTQRYNAPERDTLSVTLHLQQSDLKEDDALHAHLAFNLAHNFLDGYRHYSYDTPLWLHEGLAHVFSREVSTRTSTYDASEGAVPEEIHKESWVREAQKLARSGEAPRMSELVNLQSYGSFEFDTHVATWSMVDFLIREHPEGFACLLDSLKGRVKADGTPDGGTLRDVHREAFPACLGLSYAQFDEAWAAWIEAQVERKD